MKTLTKNIFISLFTIIFSWTLFSALSITYCYADEVKNDTLTDTEVKINDIKYILNDENNTAIVGDHFKDSSISGNIVLPESINANGKQYTLVGFSYMAFSGCGNLQAITIPDTVKSLSDDVFSNCSNLRYVKLPNKISSIPQSAFCKCTSLKSIYIPESVKSIGYDAFDDCGLLSTINFPKNLEYIGEFAVSGCSSLTSLIIPESVKEIGQWAFGCDFNVKKIVFQGSRPKMTDHAFTGMEFDLYYPEDSCGWDTSDTTLQRARHVTYHMERTKFSYDGKIYFKVAHRDFVNVDLIVDGKVTVSEKCPIENGCAKFSFDKIRKNSKVQICIHFDKFAYHTDECEIQQDLHKTFSIG